MIRTVVGDINSDQIKRVYCHEHISLDLTHIRSDLISKFNDVDETIKELTYAKKYGVNLFVSQTNIVMGRDIKRELIISKKMGVFIVASTGLYLDSYHGKYKNWSLKQLSKLYIKEIEKGIDNTNIKAGIIGEVAVGQAGLTQSETKNIIASAIASSKTGAPIATHSSYGRYGLSAAKILIKNGAKPGNIIIGHMDLNNDYSYVKRILDLGVFIGFDTIGKNLYNSEANRINNLLKLIEDGYENQIILSEDLSSQKYLKKYGGHGYDYIFTNFYPKIKNKILTTIWNKLIRGNAIKALQLNK